MIKILAIEDEKNLREMLEDRVQTYNISKKLNEDNKLNIQCLEDDSQLGDLLFKNKYDCLVLDINWGNKNPNGGRELIQLILENKRIPIVVYSGRLNQVEDIEECFGFKKFDRTVNFSQVLDYIVTIKQTRIFDLLGYGGDLDKKLNEIFWKDIDKTISSISNADINDGSSVVRVLTTRVINKLADDNNYKQKYFEFYIFPPITVDVHNGDIYNIKGEDYLVILPECQVLNSNGNFITMAHINYQKGLEIKEKILGKVGNNQINELNNRLFKNISPGEHFIPPYGSNGIGIVEFRNLITVEKNNLESLPKKATINPDYMKNIQSRFAQFYSRQGQPDIDQDHLLNKLKTIN